ncbi:MAG: transposase [Desulfobacteraceae bacterium]
MGEPALLKKAAEERIIHFDEAAVRDHLGEMVRSTVEETLNQMLEAEADRLCNAEKYERTEARKDTRAGHYQRKQQTRAAEVSLKMPDLRRQTLPPQHGHSVMWTCSL